MLEPIKTDIYQVGSSEFYVNLISDVEHTVFLLRCLVLIFAYYKSSFMTCNKNNTQLALIVSTAQGEIKLSIENLINHDIGPAAKGRTYVPKVETTVLIL